MTRISTCPDVNRLNKLAAAELPLEEMEPLLAHLQECAACLARAQAVITRDTLADLVARVKTLPDQPQGPRLASVIERLSCLGQPPAVPKPLAFTCAACGKSLLWKSELAGKKVKCPGCSQVLAVPAAGQQLPPAGKKDPAPQQDRTLLPGEPSAAPPTSDSECSTDRTEMPLSAASKPGLAGVSPGRTPSAADATQAWPPQQGDPEILDFLRPAQQADELGRLGQYRILKKLGAGGMGMVLLAEDTLLHRKVALKLMLPQFAASPSARERFLREARSAASIEHEHIVPIFQVGEDNNVPFLAMPLLKGEPLDVRIERQGKLPLAEALRIAREMAEGLAAAHANNLIHRDIKPGNVWLESKAEPGASATGGKVKLLDFGLARAQDDTTHLTQTGALVGTPAYMAPEQAGGEQLDGRADLFSLGCVLYLMLTGDRPFKGKDTMSVLMSLAVATPTWPTLANPEVPDAVSELTMRLLAKTAADRPANAQAVVDAVRGLETRDGTEILVKPRTAVPQHRTAALRLRSPLFVGIGVAAALLLLIGGYAIYQVLIIRDKDGKEIARIKVPEGARAEVVPDPKPEDGKYTPWAATPAQQAWIDAAAKMKLPERIELVNHKMCEENGLGIKLVLEPVDGPPTKCKVPAGVKVWPLLALPPLTSLDLTATSVTDFTPLARLPLTELQANLILDNVKSEAALKSMATLKTVNGRPAAEYWAMRAEIRKDIDDRVENARVFPLEHRKTWLIPVMEKLNPGWDAASGNNAHLYKDPTTGWTTILVRAAFDISPVRALGVDAIHLQMTSVCDLSPVAKTKVQSFAYISYHVGGNIGGPLSDLSPLAGLPLKHLDLNAAPGVTDFSPLAGMKLETCLLPYSITDLKPFPFKGMKLTSLSCNATDISPLAGTKLTSLTCNATDLSPLAGMPLEYLRLGSWPADLSPLTGMKLKQYGSVYLNYGYWLRTDYEPDEKLLRAMPLETINGMPAAKFWAELDAGKKGLQEFVNRVVKLTPAEAVKAVNKVLNDYKWALDEKVRIEDGAVVEIKVSPLPGGGMGSIFGTLKAFPRLKKITVAPEVNVVLNLASLMSLPIEELECSPAVVAFNAIVLRQMPTLKTINGKPAKEVLAAVR